MTLARGKVFIVGAGPGDPKLLTLRAAELIACADDLVVDALVPKELYQGASARVVYVGKRAGRPSISQRDIEQILVRLASGGRRVVRLKGGDPSVFGRGGEEMRALESAGIDYELVPGVSSAIAAPLACGIAVTERGVADRVVIMSGHSGGERRRLRLPAWDAEQTVVLLMALGRLEPLVEQALEMGYPADLPAAVISRATLPEQRVVAERLGRLPEAVREAGLETPATVVVGYSVERLVAAATTPAAADVTGHRTLASTR